MRRRLGTGAAGASLRDQITAKAILWLTEHNRGKSDWDCPVCGDSITENPPTLHAENWCGLREEALNKLDAGL